MSLLVMSYMWGNIVFVNLWTMILTGVSGAKKKNLKIHLFPQVFLSPVKEAFWFTTRFLWLIPLGNGAMLETECQLLLWPLDSHQSGSHTNFAEGSWAWCSFLPPCCFVSVPVSNHWHSWRKKPADMYMPSHPVYLAFEFIYHGWLLGMSVGYDCLYTLNLF